MEEMWLAVTYLAAQARSRASPVFNGGNERGALTLEWIVIAAGLVVAAGIAYGLFKNAITAEAKKLP